MLCICKNEIPKNFNTLEDTFLDRARQRAYLHRIC